MSNDVGRGQVLGPRSRQQRVIPGDHNEFRVSEPVRGSEVDGVVTSERVGFRQFPAPTSEGGVDLDHVELVVHVVKAADRGPKLSSRETLEAVGLSKSGSSFRVHEAHARYPVSRLPQLAGKDGAGFGDEQWDEG